MKLNWLAAWATCAACATAFAGDLADVQQRGALTVGVYRDFPPFSQDGHGIDIDLATALAQKLGVRAEVRSYDAGDNMDDDLRVIVWKGGTTAIARAPADVMLHVPVDSTFMARNPQVSISAPYYRETMAVVRNTEALPDLDTLLPAEGKPLGVEGDSITDMALMSHDGGRLRATVRHYVNTDAAPADLKSGAIAAFFGTRSQVEPMLAAAGPGFRMSVPPPMAGMPQAGWTQGLAVKAEHRDLAQALQHAVLELDRDGTLDRIFSAHGVTRLKPL